MNPRNLLTRFRAVIRRFHRFTRIRGAEEAKQGSQGHAGDPAFGGPTRSTDGSSPLSASPPKNQPAHLLRSSIYLSDYFSFSPAFIQAQYEGVKGTLQRIHAILELGDGNIKDISRYANYSTTSSGVATVKKSLFSGLGQIVDQ